MSIPADPASSAPPPAAAPVSEREIAERLLAGRGRIEAELAKAIVGQREVIEQILLAGPERAIADVATAGRPDGYLTATINAVEALSALLTRLGA